MLTDDDMVDANRERHGYHRAPYRATAYRAPVDHVAVARLKKVRVIVALVPASNTPAEAEALAKEMESWSQDRRDTFAHAAGANTPPSPTTWALVVHAVRNELL